MSKKQKKVKMVIDSSKKKLHHDYLEFLLFMYGQKETGLVTSHVKLTLFSRLTLSCSPSSALSLSCSSISWEEYEDDALMPPSSIPSKRATLLLRRSLQKFEKL